MTLHVLIVDDEAALVALLRRSLERLLPEAALAVHGCTTPEQALAALARVPPTERLVLVADVDLRHAVSGFDVARAVRAARPDAACVFMTGHVDEKVTEAVAAESARLLAKPFSLRELRDALARAAALPD